jgi:hypothetical protein
LGGTKNKDVGMIFVPLHILAKENGENLKQTQSFPLDKGCIDGAVLHAKISATTYVMEVSYYFLLGLISC